MVLFVLTALIMVACSPPRYAWQHEKGLGLADLKQDHAVCQFFAENIVLPINYNSFPFESDSDYGGYPFYGYPEPIEQYDNPVYWHRKFYRQGFTTFAYPHDMTLSCLNGKGWNRTVVDEGQMIFARQIFVPDSFDIDAAEIVIKNSPL